MLTLRRYSNPTPRASRRTSISGFVSFAWIRAIRLLRSVLLSVSAKIGVKYYLSVSSSRNSRRNKGELFGRSFSKAKTAGEIAIHQIAYKRSSGESKRKAIGSYVRKVNQEMELAAKPEVTIGPEGQVVVYCSFDFGSQAKERAARRVMAKASREALDASGIWVVGVPQNANGISSPPTHR